MKSKKIQAKNTTQKTAVSFWITVWFIIKISIISFGGGNAIFPIIKNLAVDRYKWITEDEMEDIIVITNSIPGPSTVEAMSYICMKILDNKWKGLVATFIGLLPHVLIFFGLFMLGTAYLPSQYLNVIYAAVIPVIIVMLVMLSFRYFKNITVELSYPLFLAYFIFSVAFNLFIPSPFNIPIILICIVIFIGIVFEVWKTHWLKKHPPIIIARPKPKSKRNIKDIKYKKLIKQINKDKTSKTWLLDVYNKLDLADVDVKYKVLWSTNGIFMKAKWGYQFAEVKHD